jgi:hypothetical protein
VTTTLPIAQPADALVSLTLRTGDRVPPASPEHDRPTEPSQYQVKNLVTRPH